MTAADLSSPPEGKLIRSARQSAIPKLSIRHAAARIGISPEHWGNIERGYKSVAADEAAVRVEASADLLAKMAAAVGGITAEQMETDGKRPDAAEEMRRQPSLRQRIAALRYDAKRPEELSLIPPDLDPETVALIEDASEEIVRQIEAAAERWNTEAPSGLQVFRDSTSEALLWDSLTKMSPEQRVGVLAHVRATRRAILGEQPRRRKTGLVLA